MMKDMKSLQNNVNSRPAIEAEKTQQRLESPVCMKDVKIDFIEKAKLKFTQEFVHQTLIQKVGIGATIEIIQEYEYNDRNRPKLINVAVIRVMHDLPRHYLMAIEDYFGIRNLGSGTDERGLAYIRFEVNLPKGLSEAFKAYLESI